MFWGTTDGGQVAGNWDHYSVVGTSELGYPNEYLDITDLTPGTKYYYKALISNVNGDMWSQTSNFTTDAGGVEVPSITTSAATSVAATTATPATATNIFFI